MTGKLEIFVKISEEGEVNNFVKEIDFVPSVGLEVEEGVIDMVSYTNGKYHAIVSKLKVYEGDEELKKLLANGFKSNREEALNLIEPLSKPKTGSTAKTVKLEEDNKAVTGTNGVTDSNKSE